MQNQKQASDNSGILELGMEELSHARGGIWDYSNRLGVLGQMLEDIKDRNYGDLLHPKTLDAAAAQALQGWVSIR
jgi:hypothetical protein